MNIWDQVLENNENENNEVFGHDDHTHNEHILVTSPSRFGGLTKSFDVQEVDDIIESFDVSEVALENIDSTYEVDSENTECSFDHKTQNSSLKSRFSRNTNQPTKKRKQGRSQVLTLFIISTF